jgi:hypothetical protein
MREKEKDMKEASPVIVGKPQKRDKRGKMTRCSWLHEKEKGPGNVNMQNKQASKKRTPIHF